MSDIAADMIPDLKAKQPDLALGRIIKLAVMAVGGQGGGVLTNWIEDCARRNGYAVQATSVAGVAQRTGATVYYIEMAPDTGRAPIFSLMPVAGDVDILIAAELMEAGRAIQRGFVTPDKTTLIASSHRALAVSEKMVPGDGIAPSDGVVAAAGIAAQRLIQFDMEKIAADNGTVISASLFGALAGSSALPFERASFEACIEGSGRGVAPSLKAFGAAFESVAHPPSVESVAVLPASTTATADGPSHLLAQWHTLVVRVKSLPVPVHDITLVGLQAAVDFQDIDYGREYLDRVDAVCRCDSDARGYRFSREAAKYIAKAMCYDDVIRVADLKTRGSRLSRVRREMTPAQGALLQLTEFMHPRAEELVGLLPARLGRQISASPRTMRAVDRVFNRGRRLRTDRVWSFLQLYAIGGLRRWRRGTHRHYIEQQHFEAWLEKAKAFLDVDYSLATEIVRNRRLVKGYSDTHARGMSKFDKVMTAADRLAGRQDAAEWVARLREAALKDEKGEALDGALKTIDTFLSETRRH